MKTPAVWTATGAERATLEAQAREKIRAQVEEALADMNPHRKDFAREVGISYTGLCAYLSGERVATVEYGLWVADRLGYDVEITIRPRRSSGEDLPEVPPAVHGGPAAGVDHEGREDGGGPH